MPDAASTWRESSAAGLFAPRPTWLPRCAAVETLAIAAYHQPVTRAETDAIRGVALARGTLDRLVEAGWVRPAGRRETPGRPLIWATTWAFLVHFSLDSLKDLPDIDELRAAGLLDIGPAALGDAASLMEPHAKAGQAEPEGGNI
jgi:segregation and condensation protein B